MRLQKKKKFDVHCVSQCGSTYIANADPPLKQHQHPLCICISFFSTYTVHGVHVKTGIHFCIEAAPCSQGRSSFTADLHLFVGTGNCLVSCVIVLLVIFPSFLPCPARCQPTLTGCNYKFDVRCLPQCGSTYIVRADASFKQHQPPLCVSISLLHPYTIQGVHVKTGIYFRTEAAPCGLDRSSFTADLHLFVGTGSCLVLLCVFVLLVICLSF